MLLRRAVLNFFPSSPPLNIHVTYTGPAHYTATSTVCTNSLHRRCFCKPASHCNTYGAFTRTLCCAGENTSCKHFSCYFVNDALVDVKFAIVSGKLRTSRQQVNDVTGKLVSWSLIQCDNSRVARRSTHAAAHISTVFP